MTVETVEWTVKTVETVEWRVETVEFRCGTTYL